MAVSLLPNYKNLSSLFNYKSLLFLKLFNITLVYNLTLKLLNTFKNHTKFIIKEVYKNFTLINSSQMFIIPVILV